MLIGAFFIAGIAPAFGIVGIVFSSIKICECGAAVSDQLFSFSDLR
jgi:hypothetical protein